MPLTHNPTFLRELDSNTFWETANVEERRVLIHELIEWAKVLLERPEVKVAGGPQLNAHHRVGELKVLEIIGVGEWRTSRSHCIVDRRSVNLDRSSLRVVSANLIKVDDRDGRQCWWTT
ncbi:MAG TPA: hypothetical protein VND89_00905 [Acidimicrobiales bacterium]|nr:hypothetical protein [Acidimicrobiales bacterium]